MQSYQNMIIVAIVVGSALALLTGIFVQTPRTTVRTDLIIVQETATDDFYALFKASEFLAEALAEMVASEVFLEKAIAEESAIIEKLPQNRELRLSAWRKMVYIDDVTVHGQFSVYVVDEDSQFARNLAPKLAEIIINDNGMYEGAQQIKKKVIIVKNLEGDIIEEYEENDGENGAHIKIEVITKPFVQKENVLAIPALAGIIGFFGVIFFYYIRRVSNALHE